MTGAGAALAPMRSPRRVAHRGLQQRSDPIPVFDGNVPVSWNYIDINAASVPVPGALIGRPFSIQTKNAFGLSERTFY
jgi:hypothetical protein